MSGQIKGILSRFVVTKITAIAVAAVVSALSAFIAISLTPDAVTVVTACLLSVWGAEVLLHILFSRWRVKAALRSLAGGDEKYAANERKRLVVWHAATVVMLALVLGYAFYETRPLLILKVIGSNVPRAAAHAPARFPFFRIFFLVMLAANIGFMIRNKKSARIKPDV